MKREEILDRIAPCGIDCARCANFKTGDIAKNSRALQGDLGNFRKMAAKMSGFYTPFKDFEAFEKILGIFADASCEGCRAGGGKVPDCAAKSCYKEKSVDFCGECEEFPCSNNKVRGDLYERWLANGKSIKENGIERFYDDAARKPRYE